MLSLRTFFAALVGLALTGSLVACSKADADSVHPRRHGNCHSGTTPTTPTDTTTTPADTITRVGG